MHIHSTTNEAPPAKERGVGVYALIVFLVFASGGTAGLQIALFSIDRVFLRVQRVTGSSRLRDQASKLLGVLDMQHWTLVALILMNASCMMTLPIVLESVFDELTALIVSITAVLFLGEVIPLSVFVRWAIPICAFLTPMIWLAIFVTAPVSYPVGKLLDWLLGTEEILLDREDIAALIMAAPPNEEDGPVAETGVNFSERAPSASPTSPGDVNVELASPASAAAVAALTTARQPNNPHLLREREVKMLQGAMQLSTDTVGEHLRVREPDAFMISSQDRLDRATIQLILGSGFSRIPVYFGDDRKHIIGALIVNSLLRMCFTKPDPPPLVGDYPLREVMRLAESSSLYDAYVAFRDGPLRMAAVYDTQGSMVGILTLTDVLACMYHVNPAMTVTIHAPPRLHRRRERMRELVEGLKFLNAAKNSGGSAPTTPRNLSDTVSPRPRAPSPAVVVHRPSLVPREDGAPALRDSQHSLTGMVAYLPQFTLIGGAGGEELGSDLNSTDLSVQPARAAQK